MSRGKSYLVLGKGGREHALAWKLSEYSDCYTLPGNPGMSLDTQLIQGNPSDFEFVAKKAKELGVSAVVVGPEAPLCDGIVDYLRDKGIFAFGPGRDGARLEGSKAFAKDFMNRHSIPTADSQSFSSKQSALEFIEDNGFPVVIKLDGLASGKGVTIAENIYDAQVTLHAIFDDYKASNSTRKVIVEEYLTGKELSVLAVTDSKVIKTFLPSRDHKQLCDGNKGPMTGGMGAYCPVPDIDSNTYRIIKEVIVERTLQGLKDDGIDYRGVIYFGLMITTDGPKVLEYNCRFGDPEAQVVLSRLKTPLHHIVEAVKHQTLDSLEIKSHNGFSACVVLASQGYPKETKTGMVIQGVENARKYPHSRIFYAGVARQMGKLVTSGGRVLACVGNGRTLRQALGRAYLMTSRIKFAGRQFRCDIGGRYARGRTSMLNLRFKVRRRVR